MHALLETGPRSWPGLVSGPSAITCSSSQYHKITYKYIRYEQYAKQIISHLAKIAG